MLHDVARATNKRSMGQTDIDIQAFLVYLESLKKIYNPKEVRVYSLVPMLSDRAYLSSLRLV
jgi:hypothetical protein